MDTDVAVLTARYCRFCKSETTHQTRSGAGIRVHICIACLARALRREHGDSTDPFEASDAWNRRTLAQMEGDSRE